jgi:hypothetical protein
MPRGAGTALNPPTATELPRDGDRPIDCPAGPAPDTESSRSKAHVTTHSFTRSVGPKTAHDEQQDPAQERRRDVGHTRDLGLRHRRAERADPQA